MPPGRSCSVAGGASCFPPPFVGPLLPSPRVGPGSLLYTSACLTLSQPRLLKLPARRSASHRPSAFHLQASGTFWDRILRPRPINARCHLPELSARSLCKTELSQATGLAMLTDWEALQPRHHNHACGHISNKNLACLWTTCAAKRSRRLARSICGARTSQEASTTGQGNSGHPWPISAQQRPKC